MERSNFFVAGLLAIALGAAAPAEQIAVRNMQGSMRRVMVARSEAGKVLANIAFSQAVQGDDLMLRLTYHFADGSIDDETTTCRQQGVLRLVGDHHIQSGPFFMKPVDFTVDAATGLASSRSEDKDGKTHVESEHINLPNDLANGFIGVVLLNVPRDAAPFRVGMLAPVLGGRLIRLLISPEGEQPFSMSGHIQKATVFRIHPELGGILGMIAPLIGLQPKDVMVWVSEGTDPAVVRIVGQLGGYGPVVSSELEGTSFGR